MDQNSINKSIQKIIEKKSLFLVIVVFLLFLVSAVILFGDYSSKMVNYQSQDKIKRQKIDLIAEYEKSETDLKEFLAALPKRFSTDELLSQVENYALKNHINIVNVSSKDAQNYKNYTSIGMHMSFKVKNFMDMISFFQNIEKSPYALSVESWIGKAGETRDGAIDCEINIIATQIKK